MKRIYLKEDSIKSVLNNRLLPKFIFNAVKKHETSLGDNSAFPSGGDYPYDYSLLKTRFNEVCDAIEEFGLENLDEDYLMSELSSSITLCKEMERPIRDSLEKICENSVNRLFAIPEEILNLKVKLVDKVTFKKAIRLKPESSNDAEYSFEDVADLELSNKAVEKRRFTNALIQGASYLYSNVLGLYIEDIERINRDLIPLYRKIVAINDYLLFTKKEVMSDKNPMQGSYVEVHLSVGGGDGKSSIKAQGIIFPLLLQETIRGLFELFSSHGLPSDMERAQYIIRKADFVLAEPWDMRFGVTLWNKIFGSVEDTNMIPYMFTALIAMDADTFNASVKEILANTRKGQSIVDELIQHAEYDNGYQQFTNRINAKNVDKSLIQDSYFTGAEESGLEIDSDDTDGDVIQESEDADALGEYEAEPQKPIEYYQQLVKSATVENIDFIEGNVNGVTEDLIVTINGEIVPRAMILLMVQSVKIRISAEERVPMIQVHIILNEGIQRLGLAPKIYKKLIYTFGAIYSGEGRRINKEHIAKVYAKLAQDPDLYVYHDDMCYIAMRKNGLQEVHNVSKELITESWGSQREGIIKNTVKIILDNVIGLESISDAYELERKIAEEFFHGDMSTHGNIRKFEPMVANILTKELGYPNNPTNKEEVEYLKKILRFMWNFQLKKKIAPSVVCKLDKIWAMDNFKSLVSKYKPLLDELEASGQDVDDYGNSEYEIIPIDDFDTAKKWGDYSFPGGNNEYGRLCYTQGKTTWENYTKSGRNKVFLCLNKNTWNKWDNGNYPPDDEKTPYDEYGLSMIWVFINPDGKMVYSNTRWNHHMQAKIPNGGYGGEDTDHSFDERSLERVIRMPFKTAFKVEVLSDGNLTEIANEKLDKVNRGENDLYNEFHDDNWGLGYWDRSYNIVAVWYSKSYDKEKWNFIRVRNGAGELMSPKTWFDGITMSGPDDVRYQNYLATVTIDEKKNILDVDGNFMLPNNMWCKRIQLTNLFGELAAKLEIGDAKNILTEDGRLLLDEWVSTIDVKQDNVIVMKKDGSIAVLDKASGELVLVKDIIEKNIMYGEPVPDSLKRLYWKENDNIINFDGAKNIVDENGKIISDIWFRRIDRWNNGWYRVTTHNYACNLMNINGEFIYDKPLSEWPIDISILNDFFVICKNGNYNLIKDGKLLIDSDDTDNWLDGYCIVDNEIIEISCNNKHNFIDKNFKLLWDAPRRKWFEAYQADNYEDGMVKSFKVIYEGKWNIFIPYKGLMFEEGYDYLYGGGIKGIYIVGVKNEEDKMRYNYFNVNDSSLMYKHPLSEWFDDAYDFFEGEKLALVGKGIHKNLFRTDGTVVFDEWNVKNIRGGSHEENLYYATRDDGMKTIVDGLKGTVISNQWFYDILPLSDDSNIAICTLSSDGSDYIYFNKSHAKFFSLKPKFGEYDFESNPITDSVERYVYEHFGESCAVTNWGEMEGYGMLYKITEYFEAETESLSNIMVIENGKPRLLIPKWCRRIARPLGFAVPCSFLQGKKNIFNLKTCSFLFEKGINAYDVSREEGIIVVYVDNKLENIIDSQCNIMFDEWPKSIDYIVGDFYYIYYDSNERYLYNIKNKALAPFPKNVDRFTIENASRLEGYAIVHNMNDYSVGLLTPNCEVLFMDGWTSIEIYNRPLIIKLIYSGEGEGRYNYGNVETGEYWSPNSPIYYNTGGKCVKDGKFNFIKQGTYEYVLPEWADSVTDFDENGRAVAMVGNKRYIVQLNPMNSNFAWLNAEETQTQTNEVVTITKGELITEGGWSTTKKRIVSRTLDILKKNMPWASDFQLQNIEKEIVNDYFHGRQASHPKFRIYEPMVAKILTGEFGWPQNPKSTNKDEIRELTKLLDYIWFIVNNGGSVDITCKYNDFLGKMECDDFETLMDKFYEDAKAYSEQLDSQDNGNITESHYEIRRVDSFEEANRDFSEWSYHGLPLCFTTGRREWNSFTRDGRTAYVCLKEGWDNEELFPEIKGENFPYDNYGLSMIWVFVDEDGNLTNCCIRWNHNGEHDMSKYPYGGTNADNALSETAISNIVGVKFEDKFVGNNRFRKEVKDVVSRLANGESGVDIFEDTFERLNDNIGLVRLDNKYNLFDIRTNEIISPNLWFDGVGIDGAYNIDNTAYVIRIGDKINFINLENGELIFPKLWFDGFDETADFIVVYIGNKTNLINLNEDTPHLLLPKWALSISLYNFDDEDIYAHFILFEDGSLYIAMNGDFSNLYNALDILNSEEEDKVKLLYDLGGEIYENGIVKIGNYYNLYNENGDYIASPYFFNEMEEIEGGNFKVKYYNNSTDSQSVNILKPDGKLLLNLPFESFPYRITPYFKGTVFVSYFDFPDVGVRVNISDANGNFVFNGPTEEWSIGVSKISNSNYLMVRVPNDKNNILNSNLQFVWNKPYDEWFDYVDYSNLYTMDGLVLVKIGDKRNFINCETGELAIKEEPENWYDTIAIMKETEDGVIYRVGENGRENIVFEDGITRLFNDNEWPYRCLPQNDAALIFLRDSSGPYMLFDLVNKSYISDEVFEDVDIADGGISLWGKDGTEYYYNYDTNTLINIEEERNNRLLNFQPENIQEGDKEITTFIPNKMYRITMPYTYGTRSNIIINNNGHYEYLFDGWFKEIRTPVGNAMAISDSSDTYYIYDISKLELAFSEPFRIYDIKDKGITVMKRISDFGDWVYNIVTPECTLLFDEWVLEVGNQEPYRIVRLDVYEYNLYDDSTRKFILKENYRGIKQLENGMYELTKSFRNYTNIYHNLLGKNGEPLFKDWWRDIGTNSNNSDYVTLVYSSWEFNFGNIHTGELISEKPVKFMNGIGGIAKIEKSFDGTNKVNFINYQLETLLPQWADNAEFIDEGQYVKAIFNGQERIYKIENGALTPQDKIYTIPSDFTQCNYNSIQLGDHKLEYALIGCRQGQSEHTTVYKQKVVVTTKDGRKAKRVYTQRGDESCIWKMHDAYESVCRELGIRPAMVKD